MTRRYWSSIVVRQAVVSTAVMLLAIALIAQAARVTVERQQDRALLALIDTDIAGLTDGMMSGGGEELRRRIKERTQLATLWGARYRLTNDVGRLVAGDLPPGLALDPSASQAAVVTTADGPLLARATRLRGGYALVVARSLKPSRELVGRLTALFGWAAFPAALGSLIIGAVLARRFGSGIARLNVTFDLFEEGDRGIRTGLSNGSDELAALARHVDQHLSRTANLIEAQRDISENIAHELRTPLGHLDTRLLRAIAIGGDDDAITEVLHGARDDIRAIVSLFEALLDLALAESDRPDNGRGGTFDLSERIADLAELYVASAEEAGIEFTTRIAPAVIMRGEVMAMTRAVANLLDNAFKAVPPGSHVRLVVNDGPLIIVEDDGPGIPEADRATVFQRLRSGPRADAGHGLGLALVRVIATRHGLFARLEDAGPGARFILAPEAAR